MREIRERKSMVCLSLYMATKSDKLLVPCEVLPWYHEQAKLGLQLLHLKQRSVSPSLSLLNLRLGLGNLLVQATDLQHHKTGLQP